MAKPVKWVSHWTGMSVPNKTATKALLAPPQLQLLVLSAATATHITTTT